MSNVDIISASEVEEFFYEDSDLAVSEGQLVGVEVSYKDRVDLILFDDIYWRASDDC